MKKSYADWSKFDVEKELKVQEEFEKRDDYENEKRKVLKEKTKVENDLAQSMQQNAEVLHSKAAVAALKSKKNKEQTISAQQRKEQDIDTLQTQAQLLQKKSDSIKAILDLREKGRNNYKQENYFDGCDDFHKALDCVHTLENVLTSLDERIKIDETEEKVDDQNHPSNEHNHDHNHEHDSSCSGCNHSKKKGNHNQQNLPNITDMKGIVNMFYCDIFEGLAKCNYGLKKYADASNHCREILLKDRTKAMAWIERGKSFARMGIEPEHPEAKDEMETIKVELSLQVCKKEEELKEVERKKLCMDSLREGFLSIQEMFKQAQEIMIEGLFHTASIKYLAIIEFIEQFSIPLLSEPLKNHPIIKKILYSCHINIAGCCLEMENNYDKAIIHCTHALHCSHNEMDLVGLYRRGQAKHKHWHFKEALEDLYQARQICTNSTKLACIINEIDKCIYDRGQFDLNYIRKEKKAQS